jgi:hypothetical protein
MAEYRRIRERDGANEAFEYIAHEFFMATGMMAPGKDDPMGFGDIEERATAFRDWCKNNDDRDPKPARVGGSEA